MSVINKRNAVLGWAAWKVAKMAAKRKAARAIPTTNGAGKGKLVAAAPLVLAAAGGAVVFWRRHREPSTA